MTKSIAQQIRDEMKRLGVKGRATKDLVDVGRIDNWRVSDHIREYCSRLGVIEYMEFSDTWESIKDRKKAEKTIHDVLYAKPDTKAYKAAKQKLVPAMEELERAQPWRGCWIVPDNLKDYLSYLHLDFLEDSDKQRIAPVVKRLMEWKISDEERAINEVRRMYDEAIHLNERDDEKRLRFYHLAKWALTGLEKIQKHRELLTGMDWNVPEKTNLETLVLWSLDGVEKPLIPMPEYTAANHSELRVREIAYCCEQFEELLNDKDHYKRCFGPDLRPMSYSSAIEGAKAFGLDMDAVYRMLDMYKRSYVTESFH